MKKEKITISSPDDLNKHLQHTSPATWIVLGLSIAVMVAFFAWSMLAKLTIKVIGKANIASGVVTLNVKAADLEKLKEGQKVYIADKEGTILSFNDKQPVVSTFTLSDGEYDYTIVIKEMRPADFLLGK